MDKTEKERIEEIRKFYSGPTRDKDGRQIIVNFGRVQKDINFLLKMIKNKT